MSGHALDTQNELLKDITPKKSTDHNFLQICTLTHLSLTTTKFKIQKGRNFQKNKGIVFFFWEHAHLHIVSLIPTKFYEIL